jgi:hypothetical protein
MALVRFPTGEALGPNQLLIEWVSRAIFPRVKRPEREGDYSPLSSAEVMNDGATCSLSRMFPHT